MELSQLLDPVFIAKVSAVMIMVNGILFGAYKILDAVAKFTATDKDDKIAEMFGKAIEGLQKFVSIALGSLGKK